MRWGKGWARGARVVVGIGLGLMLLHRVTGADAAPPTATELAGRIAALERTVAELQRQLAALQHPGMPAAAAPGNPVAPTPGTPRAAMPAVPAAAAPMPALSAREGAKGLPKALVKINQYDGAVFCDLAVGPDGTLHAIYTEVPEATHTSYLYYRSSHDNGKTWSAPKILSDDESGRVAGYSRILVDGEGRVYVVWKYLPTGGVDDAGGEYPGVIVYRCAVGGTWSKTIALHDDGVPDFSYFATVDPAGHAHVVWSQMAHDAFAANNVIRALIADLVQDVELVGATLGKAKGLVVPDKLSTEQAEMDAERAGKPFDYKRVRPKEEGLINLRGYVDAQGVTHFIGENGNPQRLLHFDGTTLTPVYTYVPYASDNTSENPATLMLAADGAEHLLRKPEKSEKALIRDYLVGAKLTDPSDAIATQDAKGTIPAWQAFALPGGRMALAVVLSQKGGAIKPDDLELYLTFSTGHGEWSPPLCITDNQYRQSFSSKDLAGNNFVGMGKSYYPQAAAVAMGRDGHPKVLMINVEHTVFGITGGALTTGGRVVTGLTSNSTDSPMVFFLSL